MEIVANNNKLVNLQMSSINTSILKNDKYIVRKIPHPESINISNCANCSVLST